MRIEILGTGCPKCKKTAENAQQAVEESGINAKVIKVEDLNKITEYSVMITPALVIDGEIKAAGRIPNKQEISEWIKEQNQ